ADNDSILAEASAEIPGAEVGMVETAEADEGTELVAIYSETGPPLGSGDEVAAAEPTQVVVTDWPAGWPDYAADPTMAIAKACPIVKQIAMRGNTAMIGVAVGPPLEGLEDPAYLAFRGEMKGVMTTAAMEDGMAVDMDIREYTASMNLAEFNGHRTLFTFRGVRDKQVTILTGVQDGRGVAYWFVGSRRVYSQFIKTVGLATLGPEI
ncbi:MAG: hypothetical protein AAGL98_14150, partial [Planctomycetota bacterium]